MQARGRRFDPGQVHQLLNGFFDSLPTAKHGMSAVGHQRMKTKGRAIRPFRGYSVVVAREPVEFVVGDRNPLAPLKIKRIINAEIKENETNNIK